MDGVIAVLEGAGAIILVLLAVVLVHEFGHFVFAKWSGIRVDEFAVGFGPRLLARTRGETTYSLRAIPAGGFVKMAGMLGLEGEADAGERNFYRARIPKKLITILAGVIFNFIFAIICIGIYNMAPVPSRILPGSPAQAAGMHDGDEITAVNGVAVRRDSSSSLGSDLRAATHAGQGAALTVTYRTSGGQTASASVQPELLLGLTPNDSAVTSGAIPAGQYRVTAINGSALHGGDPATLFAGTVVVDCVSQPPDGTTPRTYTGVHLSGVQPGDTASDTATSTVAWRIGIVAGADGESFPSAFKDAAVGIPAFFHDTATGIWSVISTPNSGGINGPNGLEGPVGIAQTTVNQARQGPVQLLYWIGFVSMNLGLVNLLPIPFLDGGKFWIVMLEAVRRRRLDPRHEAMAYAIGLALVVLFAIYVTIGDIQRSL